MRGAVAATRLRANIRLALAGVVIFAAPAMSTVPASAAAQPRFAAEAPHRATAPGKAEILEAFQGAALSVPGSAEPAPAIDRKPARVNGPWTAQTATPPAANAAPVAPPAATPPSAAPQATTAPQATPPKAATPETATPQATTPPASAAGKPAEETAAPMEILRDLDKLPAPVKEMRQKIMDAAASGDIQRLAPLFGTGKSQTQVMNGEFEDPIETLKNFSGDVDGQEILAILLDILSTGAAHFDTGTPDETYVWPYFTGKPLTTLTAPEKVELLRIVTAGDLAGMQENGNYNFFRLGITPDGRWKFLSGGD